MATSLWAEISVYLQNKAKPGKTVFFTHGLDYMRLENLQTKITYVFVMYDTKICMMESDENAETEDEETNGSFRDQPRNIITSIEQVKRRMDRV